MSSSTSPAVSATPAWICLSSNEISRPQPVAAISGPLRLSGRRCQATSPKASERAADQPVDDVGTLHRTAAQREEHDDLGGHGDRPQRDPEGGATAGHGEPRGHDNGCGRGASDHSLLLAGNPTLTRSGAAMGTARRMQAVWPGRRSIGTLGRPCIDSPEPLLLATALIVPAAAFTACGSDAAAEPPARATPAADAPAAALHAAHHRRRSERDRADQRRPRACGCSPTAPPARPTASAPAA